MFFIEQQVAAIVHQVNVITYIPVTRPGDKTDLLNPDRAMPIFFPDPLLRRTEESRYNIL